MSDENQKTQIPQTPQREEEQRSGGGQQIEKSQQSEPLHENAIPDFEFTPPPPPPPKEK
jgi:hypothetical protein